MRQIGKTLIPAIAATLLLGACDGLGDGNRPESIEIAQGEDGILEGTE